MFENLRKIPIQIWKKSMSEELSHKKTITMVLCRCIRCERIRLGNQDYNPRFYLRHHEFIETTIQIEENGPNGIEMKFSIYGDPLPTERNVNHEQFYSEDEIQIWRLCLIDLIVEHIFKPFSSDETVQVEVFFHLKVVDRWVPEDSLYSLTEELVQAMTGIFYTDVTQVQQFISYKTMSSSDEGMIMVVLKNEINVFYQSDFDETD